MSDLTVSAILQVAIGLFTIVLLPLLYLALKRWLFGPRKSDLLRSWWVREIRRGLGRACEAVARGKGERHLKGQGRKRSRG